MANQWPSVQNCGFWGWCLRQNGWYLVDLEKEPRNNYSKSSSCSALWPELVIMPVKPVVLLLLPSCLLVLVLQIVLYRVAHVICVCARVVGLGWCTHVAVQMWSCLGARNVNCWNGRRRLTPLGWMGTCLGSTVIYTVILLYRWNRAVGIS